MSEPAQALWAAVRLPDLSLQLFLRGAPDCGPAIVQEAGNPPRVVSCNPAAARLGIQSGMSPAAAHALCAKLQVRLRDAAKEARALTGVAAWATQFSPTVSLASTHEVLLEISGCLRLFGGSRALAGRIRAGLSELGYRTNVTLAPTPTAALLLARHGVDTSIGDRHGIRRALAPLSLGLLGQPPQVVALLATMGIKTFKDWWALPRDGLARRFGQGMLDEIDRALGLLPDPRVPFTPPQRYSTSLDLPVAVLETGPLLFAAKRLVIELSGHLAMRQIGVTRLRLELAHARHEPTPVTLMLSVASRDAVHLMTLLREKLATTTLPEGVESLTLVAAEVRPLGSHNQALFADGRPSHEERWRIVEHLRARLGVQNVYGLETFPDHRPERAWRRLLPGHAKDGECDLHRPLWLLAQPRRLSAADAPALPGKPERVESGWWDDFDVKRDYCVARDSAGAKFWLYRERPHGRDWFVHGVFA